MYIPLDFGMYYQHISLCVKTIEIPTIFIQMTLKLMKMLGVQSYITETLYTKKLNNHMGIYNAELKAILKQSN